MNNWNGRIDFWNSNSHSSFPALKRNTLGRVTRGLLLLILLTLPLTAQEKVTLTTPETKPANTAYHIQTLTLDVDAEILSIVLKGITDEIIVCNYNSTTNPTGISLITGLNKANLSSAYANNATTGSLKQRVFHRLVVMSESKVVCNKPLVGTLTGNPQ